MPTDTDPTGLQPGQSPETVTPQEGQQGDSSPAQPSLEALQQQAEQAKREAEELKSQLAQRDENFKQLQAYNTRRDQAFAQLVGANPQQQSVDPVSRVAAELKAKGYKEEEIRPVLDANARITQEIIQQQLGPLQQQLQATRAYGQVGAVMQQVSQDPTVGQLFADPEIAGQVQYVLATHAQNGTPPEALTAVNLAYMAYGQKQMRAAQNPQQQAPAPQPYTGVPSFTGMTFAGSGFTGRPVPQGQQQTQLTPAQQALDDEIKKQTGFKK